MTPARSLALSAGGLALLLAAWEAVSRAGLVSVVLMPPPSAVVPAFLKEVERGVWGAMVLESLGHYTLGLAIGAALGIGVGVAVALSPTVEAAQAWTARLLRPIPPLAWIPFAIIWFGIERTSAVFIISIGVFWINYFTAIGAVKAVDRQLVEMADAFGHRSVAARLSKVILPGALPGILAGLRASVGQGWMVVVAAELFGIPGVGQRMMEASGLLATDIVIVYMLTIALLYGIADFAFVRVQRRLLAWQR